MNEQQAREEIVKRAKVSRQLVALAKAKLMSESTPQVFQARNFMHQFTKEQGFDRLEHVQLNERVDAEPYITHAAGFLRCSVAAAQALWELIGAGYLMYEGEVRREEPHQRWTTSGGTSGWRFPEFAYAVPDHILQSPQYAQVKPDAILEPDVFALEAGVEGADPEVVEALQDAVRCLRSELYRPAVTMLGKGMEGAWIELGIALANALLAGEERSRFVEQLTDEHVSIARKIERVLRLCERGDLFTTVARVSGVRIQELRSIFIWSDVLREARNGIHFGAKPAAANTYEKAVVLFLEGSNALSKLYLVKRTAEQLAEASQRDA